ncbi:MAG: Isopentenyl-diphosphate delta-isomerase, FMN-dependent [Ktedonobacterales bacterium]|jgi:isopentenyl-diphosphate delta-isomerase|nr:MAG: Isopentenyl-diphosphate delta-isomerase, FMN-dependent [Ktedonobacterales bacterium]
MSDEVKQRKIEHVNVALNNDVTAAQPASWADVRLIHRALPEVDLDEIDTAVDFLGHRLQHPIFVSSLTGGHPDVAIINERLATVAQQYGLAMGVGSQRAALVNPALAATYSIVREKAPTAFIIANAGAPQLIEQKRHAAFTAADVRRAVDMVRADALALHLNYLQEAAQPEGDRRAKGCLAAFAQVAAEVGVPVIAKETGAGISFEQARDFQRAGASAIDVGGAGGSSMAAMESVRAQGRGDTHTAGIGLLFRDWGIPTPIAVVEATQGAPGLPIISTGGVRSGLDAARALALGATLVGMGFPFLKAASEGMDALHEFLARFIAELKVAMQLTGAATISDLQRAPVVTGGATRDWLDMRGFGDTLRGMARRQM